MTDKYLSDTDKVVTVLKCRKCGEVCTPSDLEFYLAHIEPSVRLPGMVDPGNVVAGACPKCSEFHFDEVTDEKR